MGLDAPSLPTLKEASKTTSISNEVVEVYKVHNPNLETTQQIRVLVDLEQGRIKFLARDLGKFYGLSVEVTKHLVKDRCKNLQPYCGAKLGELLDHPNMKKVVLPKE